MKIEFPTTIDQAIGSKGIYRAGGIDVQDLMQIRPVTELITDLTRVAALRKIGDGAAGATIVGATVTIAETIEVLGDRYPSLAATAREVATPQVRAVATIGGNLTQAMRCWYFRNPLSSCFMTGGDSCPARVGDNLYGIVIDQGPCAFPHPSSMGMALLNYDAEIEIDAERRIPLAALWGDGTDPGRDHLLGPGELITAIHLPRPWSAEQGGYVRSISRFAAEWPLVESACRVVIDAGIVARAAVAVGGVANTPLRLHEVETALIGGPADHVAARRAAETVIDRAAPLPQTRYKVPLMVTTITDALVSAFDAARTQVLNEDMSG